MAMAATSSGLVERMVGAAKLDVATYEAVEADTTATSQALTVVVAAAIASGLGTAVALAMNGEGGRMIGGLIGGVLMALVGWAVWSYAVYFIGTRLFNGQATYGELLRTLGFAASPQVLLVVSFVPVVGTLIAFAVAIWGLATGFVATRQALDLDNGKTIATIVIAFIVYLVTLAVVGMIMATIGLGGAMLLGR